MQQTSDGLGLLAFSPQRFQHLSFDAFRPRRAAGALRLAVS